MQRPLLSILLAASLVLLNVPVPAAAQQGGWPEVQPYPQGSTMGSQYPQVQTPDAQANSNPYPQQPLAYPQQQGQYPQQQGQYPSQQGQYPQQQGQYSEAQNTPPPIQTPPSAEDLNADRQHAVARLSIAEGQVNVKRGDTGELVAAAPNAPLLAQDRIQTAQGRAELELDYGNVVRVGSNADLGFGTLAYKRYQLQLGVGTIVYRVLRDSGAQAEIDTPSVAVHPSQPGEYRISVYDDGSSQITVLTGSAEVDSANGSQVLANGQSMLVRGDSSNPEFQNVAAPAWDVLDSWSRDRDAQMQGARSYQYVSPDVAGADDLDRNGSWVNSQYGEVWHPQVAQDWAPYSDGSWSYEPYYGWTWVDAAPWGWAPYHYGRWFFNAGVGWCWWPGLAAQAVWSPALVGFFGWGGGLAWVPLAPFEYPCRWWGFHIGFSFGFGGWGWGGRGFYGGAPWRWYHNAGLRNGVLFAGYGAFGGRMQRFGFASRDLLARSSFVNGRIPVQPTRAAYGFSNRAAFNTSRVAAVSHTSYFQSQRFGGFNRSMVAQNGYRGGQASGSTGWHSFGQPTRAGAARQDFYSREQQGSGWHSFGQPQHGLAPNQQYRGTTGYANGYNRSYSQSYGNTRQYSAPQHYSAPQYSRPQYSAPQYRSSQQYAAPRYSAPSYSAPRYNTGSSYSAPHYNYGSGYGGSHYSAPHYSAPHYSAPSGGGSYHSSGGSSHYSGGGGGHSSGGHGGRR